MSTSANFLSSDRINTYRVDPTVWLSFVKSTTSN
jgi:hypothetical protein